MLRSRFSKTLATTSGLSMTAKVKLGLPDDADDSIWSTKFIASTSMTNRAQATKHTALMRIIEFLEAIEFALAVDVI